MLWCGVVPARFTSPRFRPIAVLGLLTAVGCGSPKPPPAVAVAPPPSAAPAPAPPPPPPKCEDIKEACTADASTKLVVGNTSAWFTPPEGWHYAHDGGGAIAVNPDGTAMLILTPSPDPSDLAPAVEALVSERGIKGFKVDKLKRRLKKPQQTLPAAEGSVDLWEVDKAQQGAPLSLQDKGNGTLLVLVGKPAPDHSLLGFGFVVESVAETEAPKIMQSVQTLRGKP